MPLRRRDTTLILIGHGSSKHITSGATVRGHADHLRQTAGFAQVRAAFWQEPPLIAGCLDRIPTETAVVVPVLACAGRITKTEIPQQLAANPNRGVKTIITEPVGVHPKFYQHGAAMIGALADQAHLPTDTTLLLVGHGNDRNPASARQTLRMAATVKQMGRFADVNAAFLEQKPFLDGWQSSVAGGLQGHILVTPCMISGGLHAARHIPEFLGIAPDDPQLAALAQGQSLCGPYPVHAGADSSARLWYSRPIGCEPFVDELILDLADQALAVI